MSKAFSFLLIACTIAFCSVNAQNCYKTKRVLIHYVGIQDRAIPSLTVEMGRCNRDSLNNDSLQRFRKLISFDKHFYVDSTSFCLIVNFINKQKGDRSITDEDCIELLSTMHNGRCLSKLLRTYDLRKNLKELIELLKSENANDDLISHLKFMYSRL